MIANKKTRKLLTFCVLATASIIGRLWRGVSRFVVDWLLVGAHVVDVVVVLPVSSVFVRPLQLIYKIRSNFRFHLTFILTLALKVWSFWLRYSSLLWWGLPLL